MVDLLQWTAGRFVPAPFSGDGIAWPTREEYLANVERQRQDAVTMRKAYYDGRQYDERNAQCRQAMLAEAGAGSEEKATARAMALWHQELPEHLRHHEYSTQIQESVDFVANRLADNAQITMADDAADTVLQAALDASPELAGSPDDDEIVLTNVLREAVKAGDVPVLVRWNGSGEGTCWLDFWDCERVEMRFSDDATTLLTAIVEQVDWRILAGSATGKEEPVVLRRVWQVVERPTMAEVPVDLLESALGNGVLAPGETLPEGPLGVRLECAEKVWLVKSDQDELLDTIWWGVPFLPWWLVRGDKRSLQANRGESLIADQTMKGADRYNAVQHHAWRITRYNSHSNIVLVGDAVMLKAEQQKVVKRDVADVLTFPGATDATVLSLPTDPQMIVQQSEELKDGMYGSMGVTRVDQGSLEGLGGVTGYALEILDQKSSGTFAQIRKQIRRDLKRVANLILDCHAYWSQARLAAGQADDVPDGERAASYLEVDPASRFPNRKMEVRLGTGQVIDDAKIRDDFTAGVISLEEALRLKGYDDTTIRKIVREKQQAAERKATAQRVAFGETGTEDGARGTTSTQTGTRFNSTNRPDTGDGADDSGQRAAS